MSCTQPVSELDKDGEYHNRNHSECFPSHDADNKNEDQH